MDNDPPEPTPPLDYRDPRLDRHPDFRAHVSGTAVLVCVGLMTLVILLGYLAFSIDYRGFNQPSGIRGATIAWTFGGLTLITLIAIAIRMQRDPSRRGIAIGIWIGIGIAALIEGYCWTVMLQR